LKLLCAFIGLLVPENGNPASLPLLQIGGISTRKCEIYLSSTQLFCSTDSWHWC